MTTPEEIPMKKRATMGLQGPEPFIIPKSVEKTKSEETEIYERIDMSKFNIPSEKIHVDIPLPSINASKP